MTLDDRQPYTELIPSDGVETEAVRALDDQGNEINSDLVYKYIRVKGSTITNLSPHYWGEGTAIAKWPGRRSRQDHYYVTRAIKQIAIEVQKRPKSLKDEIRANQFDSIKGLKKFLRKDDITPWHEIPGKIEDKEVFGRKRYLMYLCQEKPEQLLKVGFCQSQIDACARGGDLGQPKDEHGKPFTRDGKEVKFHVHHRIPLHVGGANSIENLCLVDDAIHNPFFHKGDDPVFARIEPGEVRTVSLSVPHDNIHIIAVGLNVNVYIDKDDYRKGRAA